MSVRVYVPLTSAGLAALVADGRLSGPFRAHAVTKALVSEWPDGDDEDWEYAALSAAAASSWAARGADESPRRIVVAADVPSVDEAAVTDLDEDDLTLVDVAADVPWKNIASAHVDTSDYDGDSDTDLAWYATQEIRDLV